MCMDTRPQTPPHRFFSLSCSPVCTHTQGEAPETEGGVGEEWGKKAQRGQSGGRESAAGRSRREDTLLAPACAGGSLRMHQRLCSNPWAAEPGGWSLDQSGERLSRDFPAPIQSPVFGSDREKEMSESGPFVCQEERKERPLLLLPSPFNPIPAAIWMVNP